MLTVKFGERSYELNLDEQLKSLTGTESILVEKYLGGWGMFRSPECVTQSAVVLVWLAKRAAGEEMTFEAIEATPGLLFGDALELIDDDSDEPQDPMTEPASPLAATNGPNGSSGGTAASEATPETSDSSGIPDSPVSTG